ncbi:MAG: hypothetical protein JWP74_3674 [Marmoricola sp.]|nr:hypothetical protein [Marmoricola sp.]
MTASLDPHAVFAGLATVVFLVAGFDIGIAFLMRAEREVTSDDL